jgi:glucokinase
LRLLSAISTSIGSVRYSVGVDIGGTKIRGAEVDELGNITFEVNRPTDARSGADGVVEVIGEVIAGMGHQPSAIGAAVAAFVEYPSGRIAFAPNLIFHDDKIRQRIAEKFGLPVVLENDASAAAWGEYLHGAGRGAGSLIMLTVGTGIGGGIVMDGKLKRGSRGFAGEFGHMPISLDGPPCACGNHGCLEAWASGTALGRMARERIPDHPESTVLGLAGGEAGLITGAVVGEAALTGDPFALELVADLGTFLGVGMAGLARAFDPARIVVGGGVAELGTILLEPAVRELKRRFSGQVEPPQAVPASLGNDAGVVGAAALSLEAH